MDPLQKFLIRFKKRGSENIARTIIPGSKTNIAELSNGKIKEFGLNPKDLGINASNFGYIVGKDPGYNAEKI